MERGQLFFDGNNETTRLQIKDLKTTDEGEYKCEITFLDITKDCPVVQLVKLTTLGKFCDWNGLIAGIFTNYELGIRYERSYKGRETQFQL